MDIVIVSAVRTPIGSLLGSLSSVPSTELGGVTIKAALAQAGISASQVDECIMGSVLTAGVGQAPARQAALAAGLPDSVVCTTINKVCGSGLKSVMLAADAIHCGHSEIVVAGGQENMSLAPHLLEKSRTGYKSGNVNMSDSMLKDGLWDPYSDTHMGNAAEACVKKYRYSREEMDAFCIESYKRAQAASTNGSFKNEIVSVRVSGEKMIVSIEVDDEPFNTDFGKIPNLQPAFEEGGSITAANASSLNDGASALILMSAEKAREMGVKPLVRIISQGAYAQDPTWFSTAPVAACQQALDKAGLKAEDIDLWEINEAFAVVTLHTMKELNIPHEKVNVHGGAISLGHPIGASGARILTTLIHALHKNGKKYGLATLCIGGGEGIALIVAAE